MAQTTLTLSIALGRMARPLATTLAAWRVPGSRWFRLRRRVVRALMPELAEPLDQLAEACEQRLGPIGR